ncbi:MAG: head decoration protein [Aquamicrobium sp.]|uniref:head decoration protein n=1 Tax=Aquamicrobium sp. TaxID=1872579 RepID=UPI00349E5F0A|nr:head decoration protein [Aquamicrobium sp.]
MTVLHEGRHPGEFIINEDPGTRSREAVKIAASQTILANSILAKRAIAANVVATASADDGNTASSATIAMEDPAVTGAAKDGRYIGVATAATKVEWSDPDGIKIGTSTHGTPFTKGGISLTITAGGTPNVAGDRFYVDVAADAEDFEHVAFAPDGGLPIAGIAIYPATTDSGESADIAAIARNAEVNGNCIAWPTGITATEKADAVQALAALGIIVRN